MDYRLSLNNLNISANIINNYWLFPNELLKNISLIQKQKMQKKQRKVIQKCLELQKVLDYANIHSIFFIKVKAFIILIWYIYNY